MKRKFFATLLCLLMMATLLPVGSMAAESEETPLIVNGDFEDALTGWSDVNANCSVISEEDNASGTKVSPFSGKSLKITGTADSGTKIYQKLNGLQPGHAYVVEGYVNSPVDNKVRVYVAKKDADANSRSEATEIFNFFTPQPDDGTPTTGWLKFSSFFNMTEELVYRLYIAAGKTTNPVYLDEIRVYDLGEQLIAYNSFNRFTEDYQLTSKTFRINSSTAGSSFDEVEENGAINKVWKSKGSETFGDTANTVTFDLQGAADKDVVHLSYRAKVISIDENPGKPRLYFRKNNNFVSSATAVFTSSEVVDKWVTYNIWFNIDSAVYNSVGITFGKNVEWYLDDVIITKASNSYVATGKQVGISEGSNTKVSVLSGVGTMDEAYTNENTIQPFVRYAAKDAKDEALTLTAVYKKEGTKKQLMAVVSETLNSTAEFSKATIDLSLLPLIAEEDVTYTVETFLWDGSTIVPHVKKGITPITVAQ